jgi:hypothetical protein
MSDDWSKEYEGRFPPPDQLLYELAREYHERCETYDRTVCTGPIGPGGGILPATPRESGLINSNAKAILNELIDRGVKQGRKRDDIVHAIQKYDEPVHPRTGCVSE